MPRRSRRRSSQDTLQEAGGIESNVATGYHAIEFLLWGQDLNGTGPGAGERPATDYRYGQLHQRQLRSPRAVSQAASDLLVSDLEEMVAQLAARAARPAPRSRRSASRRSSPAWARCRFGEVAGERMKLGLLLHDPEEEHDCFSDNTHICHLFDAVGVRNVYLGHVHAAPTASRSRARRSPT